MLENNDSHAAFSSCLEFRAFQSADMPSEIFHVCCKEFAQVDEELLPEMLKSARHIERHFLREMPFILTSFDMSPEDDDAHICRHVWMPYLNRYGHILDHLNETVVCMNNRAVELLFDVHVNDDDDDDERNGEPILPQFPILNFKDYEKTIEANNILIYYIDMDKPILEIGEDYLARNTDSIS